MSVLPVTSYPYASLSATYAHDDNITFSPYFQQFNNGFYFISHNVFNAIDDISFNKYTGFYLTDKEKNRDLISNKRISKDENISNSFVNLFMFSKLNYVSVGTDGYLYADKFNLNDSDTFQIIVEGDQLHFLYNKNSYLILESTSPWKLKVYSNNGQPPPVESSYKFKFFKYNNNYIISTTYGESAVRERYLKASVNGDFLGFFGSTLHDAGSQIGINFIDYNYTPEIDFNGLDEQSWFYSYYNDPIDFENNLNLVPNFSKSVSGVKQNFLVSIPYETQISENTNPVDLGGEFPVANMNLDIMGMKNLKNPNYSYSKTPYNAEMDDNFDAVCDSDAESEFNQRDYRRILTGTNQEFGYEEPILLYRSNNKNLVLKTDNTTYFHYPSSAPVIKLEDVGIREAGAFPSDIPFFADKVFKKDAQYGKYNHWGDSNQFQNGQFLCAWLSGNNDDSVWMDRWYLPSELSKFEALTATYPENLACAILNNENPVQYVLDVPSVMTFEPEVWYKYFHVGSDFIDYGIDEIVNYQDQYLSLYFDDFTTENIEDKSSNDNSGVFANFDGVAASFRKEKNDTVAHLNGGNEYITINYSDEIKPLGDNTVSIWAHSDQWGDVKNGEIISNGNSNYLNFKVSNGLETPIYCLYGKDTNTLLMLNNDNSTYKFVSLGDADGLSNVENLCVDSNLNVWVLDDGLNSLYKINYNGIIEIKLDLSSAYNLSELVMDSSDNVHLLDTNSGTVSSIDSDGLLVTTTSTSLTSTDSTIQIDLNDVVYEAEGHKILFDSQNTPWTLPIDRDKLLRGGSTILENEMWSIEDFALDSDDYFFVLHDENIIHKLDSVGSILLSAVLPVEITQNEIGSITIQSDYYDAYERNENFVLAYKNGYVYKYDNNLKFIKKYNIRVIPKENDYNAFLTDWSGYDANRKFNYLTRFGGSKNLEVTYTLLSESQGIDDYKLNISTDRLYRGWHHFSMVFDSTNSQIRFYVDGELEDRTLSIPSGSQMYRSFKNSTQLGSKMGAVQPFNDEVLLGNKYHFVGHIDDFRIYTKALTDLEVKLLFHKKAEFKDIEWPIPTGNQYYAEQIFKFFKHKMSGSKSNNFNVKIKGFDGADADTKNRIEAIIKSTVKKISPAYTQLNAIKWIE